MEMFQCVSNECIMQRSQHMKIIVEICNNYIMYIFKTYFVKTDGVSKECIIQRYG